jgi:hypothetical protein
VPCSSCGGKGFFEAGTNHKVCSKCLGAREVPCLLCVGRGDLSCPKTRFDRTCPTCGYTGTVPCPDCRGKGKLSLELLAAKEAASQRESLQRREAAKDGASPSEALVRREAGAAGASEATGADEKGPPSKVNGKGPQRTWEADRAEAEKRIQELDRQWIEVQRLAAGDPIESTRAARRGLTRIQRDARVFAEERRAGADELVARSRDALKRLEAIERGWGKILEEVERLGKYQRQVHDLWQRQLVDEKDPASVDSGALSDRQEAMREVFLRSEKPVAAIRGEKPEELSLLLRGMLATSAELETALQRTRRAPPALEPRRPAAAADVPSGNPALGIEEDNTARREGTADEDESEATLTADPPSWPVLEPAGDTPPSYPRRRTARQDSGGLKPGSILGMLAVGVAGALFFIMNRRGKRQEEPLPESSASRRWNGRGSAPAPDRSARKPEGAESAPGSRGDSRPVSGR